MKICIKNFAITFFFVFISCCIASRFTCSFINKSNNFMSFYTVFYVREIERINENKSNSFFHINLFLYKKKQKRKEKKSFALFVHFYFALSKQTTNYGNMMHCCIVCFSYNVCWLCESNKLKIEHKKEKKSKNHETLIYYYRYHTYCVCYKLL